MKKLLLLVALIATSFNCIAAKPAKKAENLTRAQRIYAELHNPASKQVLVASHRADWRNFPENSLEAIESAIQMGVDIIELDIKKTKDGHLILMHDKKVDRTTNCKGYVKDYTLAEMKAMVLRAGQGAKTRYKVPTLEEALLVCKDRAVINVDHGYQYYDDVMVLLNKHNMHDHVLIKGKKQPADVQATMESYTKNMMYMPIVDLHREGQMDYLQTHLDSFPCIAYELCWRPGNSDKFESAAKTIVKAKAKVWVNTLWGSLCGGLDDDLAAEKPENVHKVYGYMVKHGSSIIQTDRPALLINYLRSKGLHD
ncbi:MAG: glycerophosphodiester phosphodiesterase family protein [Rikenellaceae bacterium]|nr:glycerophosphodiester phosphodiesterase family protein [Rikenellaceae bacterium]